MQIHADFFSTQQTQTWDSHSRPVFFNLFSWNVHIFANDRLSTKIDMKSSILSAAGEDFLVFYIPRMNVLLIFDEFSRNFFKIYDFFFMTTEKNRPNEKIWKCFRFKRKNAAPDIVHDSWGFSILHEAFRMGWRFWDVAETHLWFLARPVADHTIVRTYYRASFAFIHCVRI